LEHFADVLYKEPLKHKQTLTDSDNSATPLRATTYAPDSIAVWGAPLLFLDPHAAPQARGCKKKNNPKQF
jgi:hypothetical protein